jgi:hypothetical protein
MLDRRTREFENAHVRYIENSCTTSSGKVFFLDIAIPNWEFETMEINYIST